MLTRVACDVKGLVFDSSSEVGSLKASENCKNRRTPDRNAKAKQHGLLCVSRLLLIQALEAWWGLRVAMGMGQDAIRWEHTEAGNGGKKGESVF